MKLNSVKTEAFWTDFWKSLILVYVRVLRTSFKLFSLKPWLLFQQARNEDTIPSKENFWFGFHVSSKELIHLHLRGNLYVYFKAWEPLSQHNIW